MDFPSFQPISAGKDGQLEFAADTARSAGHGASVDAAAIDTRAFRDSLAAFPTGVVLVATQVDGQPVGMLASSFTSVSLDPPLVSLSIGRDSPTLTRLRRGQRWGISVLGADHTATFQKLSRRSDTRFEDVVITVSPGGDVLLPDAPAQFVVVPQAEMLAGDHVIVLLRVLQHSHAKGSSPLVFHRSALRGLAA